MTSPSEQDSAPLAMLRHEHRTMERVLDVLAVLTERAHRGEDFEETDLGRCVEFFLEFVDACHREREEKALRAKGRSTARGELGDRLYEHAVSRRLLRTLVATLEERRGGNADATARFLEAAAAYVEHQRSHIAKEEATLAALESRPTTDEERLALRQELCHLTCPETEERRGDLERLADELGERWL